MELEFTKEQFYKLSLSDFFLYALRVSEKARRKTADQEFQMDLQRRWEALYMNRTRGANDRIFEPTDFYRLSSDSELKDEKPVDKANFMKEMAFRFTPKNKRNG